VARLRPLPQKHGLVAVADGLKRASGTQNVRRRIPAAISGRNCTKKTPVLAPQPAFMNNAG
jgi:hypothetical protein